ncbi:MAG: 4-hydroxy-tetrahydrodipicolinate synthase [Vampirovibrionales bacterium]
MIDTDIRHAPLITALITPFDEYGKIDTHALERLVDHVCHPEGTHALLVNGTTAEAPTLSSEEKHLTLRCVQKVAPPHMPIMACIGSNDTARSIEEAKSLVETTGVKHLLVSSPYYNRPPQEGLMIHFQRIANAVPQTQLVLYNIPSRTGVEIEPDTLGVLYSLCPNIVGVKQSLGCMETASRIVQLQQQHGDRVRLWSGDDGLTLPMMACGAYGVVSVSAHVVAPQLRRMIQAFHAGDIQTARQIHLQLLDLHKDLFRRPNPTMIKALLSELGWIFDAVRPPLLSLHDVNLLRLLRCHIDSLQLPQALDTLTNEVTA